MKMNDKTLYERVVAISMDYLGPAATRFIDRQIISHLHKSPQQLREQDLPMLTDWINAAMAVLTKDQELIDEFSERLAELSKKRIIN